MKPGHPPSIENAVRSLLSVNMGLGSRERLLILGDTAGDGGELASEVGTVARRLHEETETLLFDPVGGPGQEPPVHVWEALIGKETVARLEDEHLLEPLLSKTADHDALWASVEEAVKGKPVGADVVIAITRFSISHTTFRKLLTGSFGVRFASMPLFERDMFFGPMNVDWLSLAESTGALGRALEGADICEIRSPLGTDLTLKVSGRSAVVDDGILSGPGSFGNLPAGEVFLAPLEGTAEGALVLEWGPLRRFGSPLVVAVEGGRVASVESRDVDSVRWLERALDAHPANRTIAELGIGTNPSASRPDNILESEKILGTVHVAFGDNRGFGGSTMAPYHQDFVVFDPSLVAVWECGGGRRLLLDEGRPGW